MLNRKNKSLLLFLLCIFVIIAVICLTIIFLSYEKYNYNSQLKDLAWPEGPMLFTMITAGNSSEFGVADGLYVYSSDGQISVHFTNIGNQHEIINTQKVLVSGELLESQPAVSEKSNFFIITTDSITAVPTIEKNSYYNSLSLSPLQEFIRYEAADQYCISIFSEKQIGECIDLKTILPYQFNWEENYLEGDWLKDKDEYIVRVRSREKNHLEGSTADNMPKRLIQNEVARYSYNPATSKITKMDLQDSIILKIDNQFITQEDQTKLNYFSENGGYKFIHNYRKNELGILEKSTGKRAFLCQAPYMNGMLVFDLLTN